MNRRRAFALAVAVLIVLSALPAPLLAWVSWLSQPVTFVVAPVQHPLNRLVTRLRSSADEGDAERNKALADQTERWKALYHRERARSAVLRQQIKDFELGLLLHENAEVDQLLAPVIGRGADLSGRLLNVRAGAADGVHTGAVAVIGGFHLVGRIVDVSRRTCRVMPLTDPNAGAIQGVVMLDDQTPGPLCSLRPTTTGTLVGPIEHEPGAGPTVTPGMTIRLDDDTWPEHAQMLVIGEITAARPDDTQPLRLEVTVTPRAALDRLSEVIIRTSRVVSAAEDGA